jgi:hypothetical protein
MNKVFTDSNRIVLDDRYYLEPDGFKGIVLVFHEERERTKKDGSSQTYTFKDRWYYPKLSQVMSKYLTLTQSESRSIEELIEATVRTEKLIEKL